MYAYVCGRVWLCKNTFVSFVQLWEFVYKIYLDDYYIYSLSVLSAKFLNICIS